MSFGCPYAGPKTAGALHGRGGAIRGPRYGAGAGLAGVGLTGAGLAVAGLTGAGLAVAGLTGAGLVVPGLVVPGLAGVGLVVPGPVVPGLAGVGLVVPGPVVPGPAGVGLVVPGLAVPGSGSAVAGSTGGLPRLVRRRTGLPSSGSGCACSSIITLWPSPPSQSAVAATSPRNAPAPPPTARHAPMSSLASLQVASPSVPPTMPAVTAGWSTAKLHPGVEGRAVASSTARAATAGWRVCLVVPLVLLVPLVPVIRDIRGRGPWRPARRTSR